MNPASRSSGKRRASVTDRGAGDPLLVFVHIPKTAGTTLTSILRLNEPGTRSRAIGNVFKGGGGINKEATFDHLRAESGSGLAGVRVLTGHVPLGIREYLPDERELRCFTLLREPTDRTLSHYFQIRDRRGGAEGPTKPKLELAPIPPDATLEQTIEAGYIHDNVQTRMLSGLPDPFGEVTDEMLERAKRNLREELVFFGLTERLDESLVLAKRRLGLRSVLYRSSTGRLQPRSGARATGRVNPTRPRGEEVPAKLTRAAEKCNRYDIELYRYAEEMFESTRENEGLDFEVELAALRAANAEGEVDLDVPAPAGFVGEDETWRLLLEAKATLLRHERELAKIKELGSRLGQGDGEILDELAGMKAKSKLTAGRDADAASLLVAELLATIGGALRAEREAEARGATEPAPRTPTGDAEQGGGGSSAPRARARSGRRRGRAGTGGGSRRPRQSGKRTQAAKTASTTSAGGARSGKGRGTGGQKRKPRAGATARAARPGRGGRKAGSGRQPSADSAKPKRTSRRGRTSARASADNAPRDRASGKARQRNPRGSRDG